MPNFILPDNIPSLEFLSNSEILDALKKLSRVEKFNNNYPLSEQDRVDLFKFLQRFSVDGDGEPIPPSVALERCDYFTGNPRFVDVERAIFDKFRVRLEEIRQKVPAGNELGLRFYVGKDFLNQYAVVVVPMYGPIPSVGMVRDRTSEKEKTFFEDSNIKFFALIASLDKCKISEDVTECFKLIKHKDLIGKQVVCFSSEAFFKFVDGLQTSFSKMRLAFARTAATGFVTIVQMFYDSNLNVIESRGTYSGRLAQGVFFDQGDLIPPPPPTVVDSSFEGL